MKKTLLLAMAFGLYASVSVGQTQRPQNTTNSSVSQESPTQNQSKKPANSTASSATPTEVVAKVSGLQMTAPLQQATKLDATSQSGQAPTTSHVPGQGDANQMRVKLAKFMVGDKLPEGFPEWDLGTTDKEQFKAIVATWAQANLSAVKPEYRDHPMITSKSK